MKFNVILHAFVALFIGFIVVSCDKSSKDEPNNGQNNNESKTDQSIRTYLGAIKLNDVIMQINNEDKKDTKLEYILDATDAGIDTLKMYNVKFSPMQPVTLEIVRLNVKSDKDGNISQVQEEQAAEYFMSIKNDWVIYDQHKFTQTSGKISDKSLSLDTYCGSVHITYEGAAK